MGKYQNKGLEHKDFPEKWSVMIQEMNFTISR